MKWFSEITIALIVARCLGQLALDAINRRHVLAHADELPAALSGIVDEAVYRKSVEYSLAKSRLHRVEVLYDALLLLVVLFSGLLPAIYHLIVGRAGASAWSEASFLLLTGLLLSAASMPLDWHAQFHLEERFGFNTTTPKLWLLDRAKGILLALVLGYPMLMLVLKIVSWTGETWWLWAWGALLGFQLLMLVLAPILIMPLFNKFTPLQPGTLRDRLLNLAARTGFNARNIQVMDGSKRSRHSNAFFTGFGRFRRIVLFDTLIQQLDESELEAVLAHEIGHYQRKHIIKFLTLSAAGSCLAFYLLSWLARQSWFYEAFGFGTGSIAPALLLFALLSGVATFWLSPLINFWSRRYEFQADAFAAEAMRGPRALITALRKLNEKNLSNLTPHPLYSGFYYSHPTLVEREEALLPGTTARPA